MAFQGLATQFPEAGFQISHSLAQHKNCMSSKAGPSKVKDQSNGGTQAIKYKHVADINAISHIQDETALHQGRS